MALRVITATAEVMDGSPFTHDETVKRLLAEMVEKLYKQNYFTLSRKKVEPCKSQYVLKMCVMEPDWINESHIV